MKYLLDTHVWIWWNARPQALSPKTSQLLSCPGVNDEFLLAAISIWEFCQMLKQGTLGLSCPPEEWIDTALTMPRLRIAPLSPRIAVESTQLPQPFTGDSSDQIIAATARVENATLLTQDTRFLEYKHIQTIW